MSQFITVVAQEQVAEIQLQCYLVLERSNRKAKTAITLFCRLFWENGSNEGKGQNENEDVKLAYNTNKNQEHESLFQRLQAHVEHFTNYTPTQLETFVDDRSQVSQLQTVIKRKRKLLEATKKRPSKLEQFFRALLTELSTANLNSIPQKCKRCSATANPQVCDRFAVTFCTSATANAHCTSAILDRNIYCYFVFP